MKSVSYKFSSKQNFPRPLSGFTLTEVLVYIGVLSIVIVAVVSFLFWFTRSSPKTKVMGETLDNANRAMGIMVHEIKEANGVSSPTCEFDSHPGQLSLETTHYLPANESTSYIDFYLCDTKLCLKKESQPPIELTSENVTVSNLVFSQIITNSIPSIQINLKVDYKNPGGRPEYNYSVSLESAATLRSY